MGYFLKKSNLKKGMYLQIYESYYDPERKGGAHRSFKALGYVNDLAASGIADPVGFYQAEVDRMNQERRDTKLAEKTRQISEETPEKSLGYFPLKNINDQIGVKKYLNLMQSSTGFRFNVYDMLSALVYARAVDPCSKSRTFEDVIPRLFDSCDFSLSQLYDGLAYIGAEYERIIEIYNHQIAALYPFDTSHAYFDCTNFYFEIDREDDFRRKGPSKENRKDPIVGMGLLLDAHKIPIGMKLYPGNESEKPVLRTVIEELKERSGISGKTIQIADKGLNCAENIFHAVSSGDGYIFSKSVKQLPETEKTWVLLNNDYKDVRNAAGDLLYRFKDCTDDFPYSFIEKDGKTHAFRLTEKRVVTFNPALAKKQRFEIMRLVEKARQLKASQAKRSEYGECAKYVRFTAADKSGKETGGKIQVSINKTAVDAALKIAGYNMLVTSETNMSAEEIYSAYHNLWRIEESFRVMKSQLDARPVYLQKEDTIKGHFLVCYLAVLLTRLLQFKILNEKYGSEEIFNFIRRFNVVKISERKYINLAKMDTFIKMFAKQTDLPLTTYFLSDGQIKKMLNHRFGL